MQTMNHYKRLGVDPEADSSVITAAWRAAVKKHHPDKGGDAETMRLLSAAYEVLSDPLSRSAYDAELASSSLQELSLIHI